MNGTVMGGKVALSNSTKAFNIIPIPKLKNNDGVIT